MRRVDSYHPSLVLWEIRDGKVLHQGKQLRNADPDTFEIRSEPESFLARDRSHVYHAWTMQKSVDRATFESLGDRYYKDKTWAYCEYESSLKPLKGKDPKHFVVLGNGYARDSMYGYYWGTPLRKCESPLSLEIVHGDKKWAAEYARDDHHIYYEGAALKDVDVATWQLLPNGFSRDSEHIYYCAWKLPGVRPGTWRHLEGAYSRDEKSVFLMHIRLKDADPDRWRLLGSDYSTDGKNVYFVGKLVPDADASTFTVDKSGNASDAKGLFSNGSRQALKLPRHARKL